MQLEALTPLTIRLRTGDVTMRPGHPVEFSEEDARKILMKAEGKVRQVEPSDPVMIEPAHPHATPIYWQRATGIVGPGIPEFVATVGTGPTASYWVIALYEGVPVWVNSTALRSKQSFKTQVFVTPVDLIRE